MVPRTAQNLIIFLALLLGLVLGGTPFAPAAVASSEPRTSQQAEETPQPADQQTMPVIVRDKFSLDADAAMQSVSPEENALDYRDDYVSEKPDERILWQLFHHKKYDLVQKLIAQWRQNYPGWSPPRELPRYLAEQQKNMRRRQLPARAAAGQAGPAKQRSLAQQQLAAALASGSIDAALRAASRHAELLQCGQPGNLFALLPVYSATHSQAERLELLRRMLAAAACRHEEQRLAILQTAQNYLDVPAYDELLAAAAPMLARADSRARLEETRYGHHSLYLVRAIADGKDSPEVIPLIERMEPEIRAARDGPVALSIGWFWMARKEPGTASGWFEQARAWLPADARSSVEARYGLALAMHQQGKDDAALALAEENQRDIAQLRPLIGEILLARAWEAFQARNFARSRDLAEEAMPYLRQQVDGEMLLAWLDYAGAKYRQALAQFENLYQQYPGPEPARGIVACKAALHAGPEALTALALSNPADFGQEVRLAMQKQLYQRKEFRAAAGPGVHPGQADTAAGTTLAGSSGGGRDPRDLPAIAADEAVARPMRGTSPALPADGSPPAETWLDLLENIDSPAAGAAILYRRKKGDSGTSALQTISLPTLEATYVFNEIHELGFSGHRLQLASGLLDPWRTAVGSAGVFQGGNRGLADPPDIHLDDSWMYSFDYQKSGWWHPFLSAGATPAGAPVAPALMFRGGVKRQIGPGAWQMAGFSEPVRDSVLSFVGMDDPYSGRQWGRVLKTGAEGSLLYQLAPAWSLSAKAQGASLAGKDVDENRMLHLSGGLGHDLQLDAFDYFTVGPFFRFEHYTENLSHFTLGHGGYFSPEKYYNTGLGLDFLTAEGRDYSLKGHAGIGFQSIDNAAAELFPGRDDLRGQSVVQADGSRIFSYPADSSRGPAYDLELGGCWLLGPHWQASSGLAYRKTNGYEDYFAGIGLRYFFKARKAAFSGDIPVNLFELLY